VKKSPKLKPKPPFCKNQWVTFTVGNSSPQILGISVIFKKLPRVNIRPTCENSPNLATLLENRSLEGSSQNFVFHEFPHHLQRLNMPCYTVCALNSSKLHQCLEKHENCIMYIHM
jgi:hypothetical protein